MKRLERFAVTRPVLFGVVVIVVWSLLTALTYPVHMLFPDNELGNVLGEATAKLVVAVLLIGALWRFGWLGRSGLTRWGAGRDWMVVAVVGAYLVCAELYAFTGEVGPVTVSSPLAAAQFVATFPGALLEEILFRGLVLTAMLLAWGQTRDGVTRSVVLSSALFGATHLVNLMVRPAGVVLFQAAVVSLPGILYGALRLRTGTLWPAILIHWLTNAAVNVKITEVANYEESASMWLWFALFLIPTAVYDVVVLSRRTPRQGHSRVPGEHLEAEATHATATSG